MGLIDLVLLAWIAVFVVFGIYRGFCVSLANVANYFIAGLMAYILHPLLSWLLSGPKMIGTLINYTEGAAKMNLVSIDQVHLPITSLNATAINELVDKSSLVSPFADLVKGNMLAQNLADKGMTTVGQYFDYTVAYATLNILSFLVLFVVISAAIGLFISATNATHPLPVLKHYDGLIGGLLGLIRGFLSCYLIVALLPVGLSIVSAPAITQYLTSFPMMRFFYSSNFILMLIRGGG